MFEDILMVLAGAFCGCSAGAYWQGKRLCRIRHRADKDSRIIDVQSMWLHLYQEYRSLDEFFYRHNYKKIAVQGLGKLGRSLIGDLSKTDIEVVYGIDRNTALSGELGIPVYTVDDSLTEVDAVIITAIADYNTIASQLYEKLDCPLIPLDAMLNELID